MNIENIERLTKYLDETGLGKRFEELKPGESFGVELPIDEENGKTLRFWLSTEGSEDVEFVTLDFEGVICIRIACDEKKLDDWLNKSGILELGQMMDSMTESEETKE